MDARSRSNRRRWIALAVLMGALTLAADRPVEGAAALSIHGADADEAAGVRWAWERFRQAGVGPPPPVAVHLHASHDGCNGGLGRYRHGRVDLCTKDSSEPYARKFALHELAHAWVEANLDGATLERFMALRGLQVWNDAGHAWKERGSEQVAEIITWGLGEGEIAPLLPEAEDPEVLAFLFEMLTGLPPITPAAG
jgi:hypothetical protein